MHPSAVVPVGLRRPGPRPPTHDGDRGAATVEAAFGVLALVAIVAVLAWCLSLLVAQLAVGEAARAAARVAARGEGSPAVAAEARRLVGDAEVEVRVEGDHVVVEVGRAVAPPGGLGRWGAVRLQADATALVEPAP